MEIAFVVPGEPVAWQRPADYQTPAGRRVRLTPAQTRSYGEYVAWCARRAMGDRPPIEGAVRVSLHAYLPPPRSWSRGKREAALAGAILPAARPDLDNLAKILLDSISGTRKSKRRAAGAICFGNDWQVCDLIASKRYAMEPRMEVRIEALAPDGPPPG